MLAGSRGRRVEKVAVGDINSVEVFKMWFIQYPQTWNSNPDTVISSNRVQSFTSAGVG
jgi:hypothetical protein